MSSNIRNFSIVAHIDHGKSTLADRLLEHTGTIEKRLMKEQILDSMDLERERGVTIKAKAIRIDYKGYILNLIDTPGHVDFGYEVSRALAACEGALLVVDAAQGIEAQTLANAYLAINNDLKIIPVINKIDLPSADPKMVAQELDHVFGIKESEIVHASAKSGMGIEEVLNAIIERVPPPEGDPSAPLQALIFDSHYDIYRGVVIYTRIVNGKVRAGEKIRMMGAGTEFEVIETGIFKLGLVPSQDLSAGEVGYIIANIKDVRDAHVGDTITSAKNPSKNALPGYKKAKPMVFCGLYPIDGDEYTQLKDALDKLSLNDASLFFEPETSLALGFGFRCGFLGLLHFEIIQERLEREYKLSLIATAPNVVYKINLNDKKSLFIDNPSKLPDMSRVHSIEEPYYKVTLLCPERYVGSIMTLASEKRGTYLNMEYLDMSHVMLTYEFPLAEIVTEFYDMLKSVSQGYASMDYEFSGYREAHLAKLDILINDEPVDALSMIVPRDNAYFQGRKIVEKLRGVIPRQMFEVPIQAAIGSKIIARETVKATRKDVTAKCYGGDVSRKRKLLEKQKEGKKRMKRVGRVDIPQEAFLSVLKMK
ncbi:MAG: translation elongation factor 4 [Candidatus ainarchaeum sp.]|nr:translation elongation factor 4 [Candidatus ainarchaeum sp.]